MMKMTNGKIIKFFVPILTVSLLTGCVAFAAPQTQAKMKASVDVPTLRGAYNSAKTSSASNKVKLEGDVSLSKGNQIISVSLRDTDVKQALRMFADKAGLNIIFHDSVKGKITMDLVNVTLNNAFKMIMQMSELTYVIDHDTIMVMSSQAAKNLNVSMEDMDIIPVKYVDASAMARFLNTNVFSTNKPGLSNNQIVVTNPGKNELIVFGTDSDYRMAKKIVDKLDKKPVTTTYKVNHTTPREMANLLCQSLFAPLQAPATAGATGSSTSAAGGAAAGGMMGGMPGAAGAAGGGMMGGMMGGMSGGGGAAASSAGAAGGAAGGGMAMGGGAAGGAGGAVGASSVPAPSITLGGGVVACRVTPTLTSGQLASLTSYSLTVIYDTSLGSVSVIGGSPEQINMISDFIASADRKQPQAYMEFSIVELTEDGSKSFNNNWSIASQFFSADFSPTNGLVTNGIKPTFWTGNSITPGNTAVTTGALSKYTGPLTVAQSVSYLVTNGKGRILANPKVMVTNGQTSTIDLTSDYIASTTSQLLQGNGITAGIQKTYNIAKDNGMKIEVTPFISPDGYVSVNLKPNYATIKEQITDPGADGVTKIIGATLLQRRNLDLKNVRIKDGETLVIGGLIQETEKQTVSKLPILGDIPVLGTFFRNSQKVTSKGELVIMLTPRIITDTEDAARL